MLKTLALALALVAVAGCSSSTAPAEDPDLSLHESEAHCASVGLTWEALAPDAGAVCGGYCCDETDAGNVLHCTKAYPDKASGAGGQCL